MPGSRIVSSEQVYNGRLLQLELLQVEGPDSRTREREVVRHPGAVAIVPLLEEHGQQKVILIRQYRVPLDRELWEIPAGTLEAGESPLQCAKRELSEETGYRAHRWERLVEYYSTPGFCDERLHLYFARELEPLGGNHPDEGEFLQIEKFPLEELKRMLKDGKLLVPVSFVRVEDAKTLIGLLALFAYGQ
jgi:ADP-ribose pyrophosphatase